MVFWTAKNSSQPISSDVYCQLILCNFDLCGRVTNMNAKRGWITVLALLVLGAMAQAGPVGYTFDMTAAYGFGFPPDAGPTGAPDTGFVTFFNSGPSTFTGTLSLDGTSPGEGHLTTTLAVTMAPGASGVLTLSSESSNQGGWNGGSPNIGISVEAAGTFSGIGGTDVPVDFLVHDPDFHSGGFRTNPFGVTLDNYILQGGDPFGRDTGDGYETTQASATLEFSNAPSSVPEPRETGVLMVLLAGLVLGARTKLFPKAG